MTNDVDALHKALAGYKGALDEWMELRNEDEVRAAILAVMSPAETLRDKFAGMAAAAVLGGLAAHGTSTGRDDASLIAMSAYRLADAMLAARTNEG